MTPQRSRVYIESRREMPFNLKSRRPPDISNNNATDITVGWELRRGGGVLFAAHLIPCAKGYIRILPPRLKTSGLVRWVSGVVDGLDVGFAKKNTTA